MCAVVVIVGNQHHLVAPCANVRFGDMLHNLGRGALGFGCVLDRQASHGDMYLRTVDVEIAGLHVVEHSDIVVVAVRAFLRRAGKRLPDRHGHVAGTAYGRVEVLIVVRRFAHDQAVTRRAAAVMPHLEQFAPGADIGLAARKFVVYLLGVEQQDIHSVHVAVHPGYGARAFQIGRRSDDQHVGSLHTMQILVGHPAFGGNSTCDARRRVGRIFAVAAGACPHQGFIAVASVFHGHRPNRICYVPDHGALLDAIQLKRAPRCEIAEKVKLAVAHGKSPLVKHLYVIEIGQEQGPARIVFHCNVQFVAGSGTARNVGECGVCLGVDSVDSHGLRPILADCDIDRGATTGHFAGKPQAIQCRLTGVVGKRETERPRLSAAEILAHIGASRLAEMLQFLLVHLPVGEGAHHVAAAAAHIDTAELSVVLAVAQKVIGFVGICVDGMNIGTVGRCRRFPRIVACGEEYEAFGRTHRRHQWQVVGHADAKALGFHASPRAVDTHFRGIGESPRAQRLVRDEMGAVTADTDADPCPLRQLRMRGVVSHRKRVSSRDPAHRHQDSCNYYIVYYFIYLSH